MVKLRSLKSKRKDRTHDDWGTPPYVKTALEKAFGVFDFDPCPLHHNIKKWNGLIIHWKKNNFVNPSYNKKTKESFIKKGFREWYTLRNKSVFLLPVSTSTGIFHNLIITEAAHVVFIKTRIKFHEHGDVTTGSGFRDNMLVIIGDYFDTNETILTMEFFQATADCMIMDIRQNVILDTRQTVEE